MVKYFAPLNINILLVLLSIIIGVAVADGTIFTVLIGDIPVIAPIVIGNISPVALPIVGDVIPLYKLSMRVNVTGPATPLAFKSPIAFVIDEYVAGPEVPTL